MHTNLDVISNHIPYYYDIINYKTHQKNIPPLIHNLILAFHLFKLALLYCRNITRDVFYSYSLRILFTILRVSERSIRLTRASLTGALWPDTSA